MNSRALKVLITGLTIMAIGSILKITDDFYIGMAIAFIIEGTNAIIESRRYKRESSLD
jgi:hypothetical protein